MIFGLIGYISFKLQFINNNGKCVTVRCDWFDQVTEMAMEQDPTQENSPLPETNISSGQQAMQVFTDVPTKTENAPETFHLNDPYLVPVTFQAKPTFNLNTDAAPLSLNLCLASSFNLNEQPNSRHSAFTMMPSFSDGDSNSSIIRVAQSLNPR